MPGRNHGRGGRQGRGGRGKGRSHHQNTNRKQQAPLKMVFAPMEAGKPQKTYQSVLEAFQMYIQKNYNMDVAKSIKNLKEVDLSKEKPTRQTHADLFSKDETKKELAKSMQNGYDIDYQIEKDRYEKRKDELRTGLYAAYAELKSEKWMHKNMKDRLDAHELKSTPEDDVVGTLIAMKELMQAPQRAQYTYKALTDALIKFIKCIMSRKDEESLVDWGGRFKQARDVLKTYLGTKFLDEFVEKLPEYQSETDADAKKKMKDKAFDNWYMYLALRNADQLKFGSILADYESQYKKIQDGKPKNEFPATLDKVWDILSDHKFDPAHTKDVKDRKQQHKEAAERRIETILAQQKWTTTRGVCHCCGVKDKHYSPDCLKKDKIPYENWWINKAVVHYQNATEEQDDELSSDEESVHTQQSQRSTSSRNSRSGKTKSKTTKPHPNSKIAWNMRAGFSEMQFAVDKPKLTDGESRALTPIEWEYELQQRGVSKIDMKD